MSTDQPENDPFRKRPQSGERPGDEPRPGEPPPAPPPPGAGGSPYGGPYGSSYGDPYGGAGGAPDPLAGMPPLASRGKRFLARIIDALLIGIPVYLLAGIFGGLDVYGDSTGGYWVGGIYTLVYLVYEGLLLSRSGQTVGKKLMSIRVAMLHNGAVPHGSPAWLRAVVYNLPPLVPCFGFLFWLVNVLFCIWDKPYQQCLHDKAVKTVVVAA